MENQRKRFGITQETFSDEFVEEILSDWSLSEINLTSKRKRLLAVLLHISGIRKEREFFAENLWLSEVSGYASESKLINALRKLESMGLIERKSGKRAKASEYRIPYDMEEEKEVILEKGSNKKGSNNSKKGSNKKGSKTAENPVLIEADDKKGSNNETGVLAKKGSTDTDIYTDIDKEKDIKEYIEKYLKEKIENISENSLLKIIEMKTEKIVKETFEKKLLDIVEKTIRDYLDKNLESIVERVCGKENTGDNMSVAHATPADMFTNTEIKQVSLPNGYRQELSLSDFYKENTVIRDTVETENKAGTAHALQINLVKEERGSEAPQTPVEDKQEPLPSGREQEPLVKEELKDRKGSEAPSKLQSLLDEIEADPEVYDFFDKKVFDTLGRFSKDLSTKMTFVNTTHNGCNAYFQARRSTSVLFPDDERRNHVRQLLHQYLNAIVKATLSPESIAKHSQKKGTEAVEESARLRKKFQEQYLQRYELEKDK